MENAVQKFDFKGHAVRVEKKNDQPWFVAKDVCDALGISKYRDAVKKLFDIERVSMIVDTPGGPQEMVTINKSGLYALVMKSRKPEAKAFRYWLTSEVLPSIEETGGYVHPTLLEAKESPALLQSVQALSNGIDKLHQVQQHFDTRVLELLEV